MVWARTKLTIWDDLFPPSKKIFFTYVGKTPEKLYPKFTELLHKVFSVGDEFIQERTYNWQKKSNGNKFKVEWYVEKPFDKYTLLNVDISMKGESENGYGKVEIKMEPRLVTEYPQDYLWQQSILYEIFRQLWHKLFYNKKRQVWMDESKELCFRVYNELKHYADKINSSGEQKPTASGGAEDGKD